MLTMQIYLFLYNLSTIIAILKKYILIIAVAILALSSCGNGDNFRLSGTIDNAANTTLYLQSSINGRWIVIDTVSVNDNGGFDYQRQAPRFPEIYRLVLDDIDNAIYFPIDSLEHLTINSSKENFGTAYTLEGSEQAVNMMNIDKKAQAITRKGIAAAGAEYVEFKKELVGQILANPSSILAYYIINKHIGDVPVFSPADKNDVRIIGAVANAYNAFKPNDPRTKLLVATFLSNRQIEIPNTAGLDTIVATEAKILDIELPDRNGNMQKLSDVTSKGNVVVLSFTAYSLENSPAYNKLLSDIYSKYSSRGFEIYQVGLDSDVAQWKLSANNLPWITVYDEAGTNSNNVIKYNVGAVPMSYVIDRSGEIQSRVIDQTQLDSEVAKLL